MPRSLLLDDPERDNDGQSRFPTRSEHNQSEFGRGGRRGGGGSSRGNFGRGGGGRREEQEMEAGRMGAPTKRDMEMEMTGKERREYLEWKAARDKVDEERLARTQNSTGQWRREWDLNKSG